MRTKSMALMTMIALGTMILGGCKKESQKSSSNSSSTNNNGGSGGGTFTPPTTNYYIIDTAHHQSSMDAVNCSMNGGDVGLVKNFPTASIASANLHLSFPQNGTVNMRDITAQVSEGTYVAFNIDSVGKANDQVKLQLEFQYNGEYYYLDGKSGKLYVSKLNGKLRYTTDGTLNVNGPKWASGFVGNYTRQLKFSIECGAQF